MLTGIAAAGFGARRLDVRSMAGGALFLAAFCLASYASLARRAMASCFAAAVWRKVRLASPSFRGRRHLLLILFLSLEFLLCDADLA